MSRGERRILLDLARLTDIDAAGIGELSFFSRIHYGGGAACAVDVPMVTITGLSLDGMLRKLRQPRTRSAGLK